MKITGTTQITGIFGHPVVHTLSPSMHNAAFDALKLGFVYLPFEVKPGNLGKAVDAVRALNLAGVNVTHPHKENVIRFLDKIDPLAKRIGSVNTIVNRNGVLTGYNTDGSGFLKDLEKQGFRPGNKTAVMAGAGGAGRAMASTLSWAGARVIYITDMQEAKARKLAASVPRAKFIPFKNWTESLDKADIFINATPLGMHAGDPPVASGQDIKNCIFVYDVVYNRRTKLIDAAQKGRVKCSGGLGMLLYQGALAFELWTGKKAPVDVMRQALITALNKNREKK